MKRNKLLALAVATMWATGAWAQTDVTSTYLVNADFSEGPVITTDIRGYGKDMVEGDVYGFQDVTGWTKVVTKADNSIASFPNSAMGGGVLAYGSANQMKGNSVTAPAAGPDASATNGLGFFAVWGCGGYYYQEVTLPAGKYTITFPIYCISGTQANTTYTGFFPTSGTNRTVAINTTVGSWVNQTVEFNLTAETAGQIRLGYQSADKSTGNGSGVNPHLVFDGVKIEYTAAVVKDVLQNAITAATAANNVLADANLAQAIAAANVVYNRSNATQEQINTAAAALNSATEVAMDGKDVTAIFVSNPGFDSAYPATENYAAGDNPGNSVDYADEGWTRSAQAAWSSSAIVEYGGEGQVNGVSAPDADNLNNGGYTLGVSVGWGATITYKSETMTFPAGVYTLSIAGYNNLEGVTQFASKFGFVPTDGTATLSTKKAFTYGTWENDQVTVTLNEATEGYIQVGGQAISGGSGSNAKVFFDNVTITYSSFLAGAQKAWQEAGMAAAAAIAANPNVTGAEKAALVAAVSATPASTVEGYNAAAESINAATAALVAAAPAYNSIVDLNARAVAAGIEPYAITSKTTAAELIAAIPAFENSIYEVEHSANVATFNQVQSDYPYDVPLGAWTTVGNVKKETKQHWSGDESVGYDEPNYWNSSTGGAATWQQEITLPAGSYVLKLAGRHSANMTLVASVVSGEEVLATAADFPASGSGRGIDVNGDANFSEDGDYANSGTGWGFEWRFLPFTLSEEAAVTIFVQTEATTGQQWASFCDYVIKAQNQKATLKGVIDTASRLDLTANVGTKAFQKVTDANTILSSALADAQKVYNNPSASDNAINTAIDNLNADVEYATEEWNNAPLNEPDEDQLFNLVLTYGGYQYDNKAVTYIAGGRSDAGGYGISYQAEANTNLAQAFTLTCVENDDYVLSQVDADGNVRYVCTGTVYGGDDLKIRTTLNEEEAALFTVKATMRDGVYNLWNVAANQYIGSQDNGFYTVNSHIDFQIVETSKASVNVKTSNGWGTVILPFAAEVPAGVTAYVVEGFDGTEVSMSEVDALAANTPYLLIGSVNVTLKGDAQGTAISNKLEGNLLTGVYAETLAPVGSYVKEGNHFAIVNEGEEVSVAANEAYLTYPLGEEEEPVEVITAIKSLAAQALPANSAIYNLAGQQVSKAVKGIYVQNGKKVVVK